MQNYIGIDWAQSIMAIARLTDKNDEFTVFEQASNIKELIFYLKSLPGKTSVTVEETTGAQWLYTELKPYCDQLIICDPYRNRLLAEGVKNDKNDAVKLARLLKANMLKEVFHTGDESIHLRKLVRGYEFLINTIIRFKNNKKAIRRACGTGSMDSNSLFVNDSVDPIIECLEEQKARYLEEFKRIEATNKQVRDLRSIPGIGLIGAVKLVATIVDIGRFKSKSSFWAYSGLIKYQNISGGKVLGKRNPRYSRLLKCVFKVASLSTCQTGSKSKFNKYYHYLIEEKKYLPHNARNAVARKIANTVYGVLKTGNQYDAKKIK